MFNIPKISHVTSLRIILRIFCHLLLSLYCGISKDIAKEKRFHDFKGQVSQLHAAILDMQANVRVYLCAHTVV